MQRVLVIGGTGLLGYHTTLELLSKGYAVTSLALPPMPVENLFPEEVTTVLADINEYSDEALAELISGHYAIMYAAGADERVVPDFPSAKFFYEQNVRPVQRVARIAAAEGVKKFVLFNSYTAEWGEQWPDLGYRERNGYPRTRLLQEEVAIMEGNGAMDVTSLRLPYIFGTMPGRQPLWHMFIDIAEGSPERVTTQMGSTSSVTVKQVAQSAVGAMEKGVHGAKYPINGYNLKYTEFMGYVCEALGRSADEVMGIPYEAVKDYLVQADAQVAAAGKEHGIHLVDSVQFQARDAVSDPAPVMAAIGYEADDVVASIKETLAYCMDNRALYKSWQNA